MAMTDPPATTPDEDSKPGNIDVKIDDGKPTGVEVILSNTILVVVALNNLLICCGTMYDASATATFPWSTGASAGNSTGTGSCNQENDYCNKYCGLEPGDDDGDIVEESSWDNTLKWLQFSMEGAHQKVYAVFMVTTLLNNYKKRKIPKELWTWKLLLAVTGAPIYMYSACVLCIVRLAVVADFTRFMYYFLEITCVIVVFLRPTLPLLEKLVNLLKDLLATIEATLKTKLEDFKANEDALRQLRVLLRVNREILHNMTKRGHA